MTLLKPNQQTIINEEAKLAINDTSAAVAYLHMAIEDLQDALEEAAEIGHADAIEEIDQQIRSIRALIAKLTVSIKEAS